MKGQVDLDIKIAQGKQITPDDIMRSKGINPLDKKAKEKFQEKKEKIIDFYADPKNIFNRKLRKDSQKFCGSNKKCLEDQEFANNVLDAISKNMVGIIQILVLQ